MVPTVGVPNSCMVSSGKSYTKIYGYPTAGWFLVENPNLEMDGDLGIPLFYGNHQMVSENPLGRWGLASQLLSKSWIRLNFVARGWKCWVHQEWELFRPSTHADFGNATESMDSFQQKRIAQPLESPWAVSRFQTEMKPWVFHEFLPKWRWSQFIPHCGRAIDKSWEQDYPWSKSPRNHIVSSLVIIIDVSKKPNPNNTVNPKIP